VTSVLAPTRAVTRRATVDSYGLPVDASVVCIDAWRSRLRPLGVNLDRGVDFRSDRSLVELASTGVGHRFEIRVEQDARRDLTLRSELLAHPKRRGGVTRPYVRLRASARAVRSDCRAATAHGEARWSLASDVVVVAIAGSGSAERRLSASLQRFSSVLS
jgi:hypothetical protein